jgi:hypothetical protein
MIVSMPVRSMPMLLYIEGTAAIPISIGADEPIRFHNAFFLMFTIDAKQYFDHRATAGAKAFA